MLVPAVAYVAPNADKSVRREQVLDVVVGRHGEFAIAKASSHSWDEQRRGEQTAWRRGGA